MSQLNNPILHYLHSTNHLYENPSPILQHLISRETQSAHPTPLPFHILTNYALDNEEDSMDFDEADELSSHAFSIWTDNTTPAAECTAFMADHHLKFSVERCNHILLEIFEWMSKPRNVSQPYTHKMKTVLGKIQPLIQSTIHNFNINPFQKKYGRFLKYTLVSCLGSQSPQVFQKVKDILLQYNPNLAPACDDSAPIIDEEDKDTSLNLFQKYLHKIQKTHPSTSQTFHWAQAVLQDLQT